MSKGHGPDPEPDHEPPSNPRQLDPDGELWEELITEGVNK
jgi:hypothetical protein